MAKDTPEWTRAEIVANIMDLQWPKEKYAARLLEMGYNEGWLDGMRHAVKMVEKSREGM
jgi:hypothetical protein